MEVLIACEFSGIVSEAFARRGHKVISCDYLPIEKFHKNMLHTQQDVREILGGIELWPQPNHLRHFDEPKFVKFDLMIAFPPCTHLAVSGARWFKDKQQEQREALAFIKLLMDAPITKIAIENPIGVISTKIRKPSQIIQPWQFGHGETKATCLWLKNLPLLKPTNIVEGREGRVWKEAPSPDRWKKRSRTYQGIADAMAEQWGNEVESDIEL